MSILIMILAVVGVLIAIVLIMAILRKDEYVIERDVVVNKVKAEVYNYLKYLKNAESYNKWVMMDPKMKKDLRGTDGTVGFIYAWESKNSQVGAGEQEIKKLEEGETVSYEIRFIKPFVGIAYVTISLESAPNNHTKVKWIFSGKYNFMMKVMHILLNLEKALGKDMQTSLNNLKSVLEK